MGYQPATASRTNGYAVASLILGIMGLLIQLFGILPILAIVFGVLGKNRADRSQATGEAWPSRESSSG